MSGYSDVTSCPNCGGNANESGDHKPFSHVSITCLECGFQLNPIIEYMNLEELNEARKEEGLEPLEKLPKQNENVW